MHNPPCVQVHKALEQAPHHRHHRTPRKRRLVLVERPARHVRGNRDQPVWLIKHVERRHQRRVPQPGIRVHGGGLALELRRRQGTLLHLLERHRPAGAGRVAHERQHRVHPAVVARAQKRRRTKGVDVRHTTGGGEQGSAPSRKGGQVVKEKEKERARWEAHVNLQGAFLGHGRHPQADHVHT